LLRANWRGEKCKGRFLALSARSMRVASSSGFSPDLLLLILYYLFLFFFIFYRQAIPDEKIDQINHAPCSLDGCSMSVVRLQFSATGIPAS
jgi:hypothetical protein